MQGDLVVERGSYSTVMLIFILTGNVIKSTTTRSRCILSPWHSFL